MTLKIQEYEFLFSYWLVLIPILWLFLYLWYRRPRTSSFASIADVDLAAYNHFYHPLTETFIQENTSKSFSKKERSAWQNLAFWVYGLVFSLLLIALAQPIKLGKQLPDPPPERDIVFLVDTSVSMQLKDYNLEGKAISRMTLLRTLLDEFTQQMRGEKISVILFAEKPYVLVPFTNQQDLIRRMLTRITTSLAGRYTAIGEALIMALNLANKQTGRHQTFILFTDADTSRGKISASAAAQVVGENGIPIYTIAIGSSQKADDENVAGGLYQAVDLTLLEDISKRSDGLTYQVNNADAMKQALQSILKQRQNLATPKPQFEQIALYFYPLAIAILLLLLWQFYRLLSQARQSA